MIAHNDFKEALGKLNLKQQKAVNQLEDPLLVVAGPGTGKTQILAARIGNILANRDVNPHNILCLTYTDAGATAMRQRLLQFIGTNAYQIHIYTFHAFCNDIIQNNLEYFGKNALSQMSDLDRREFIKSLILNWESTHNLKKFRGDIYNEVYKLERLFSIMKKEDFSPEFISQKIDEYLESLPFREDYIYKIKYKEFEAGSPKQSKIKEETERMERLRSAAMEFPKYEALVEKAHMYDFDDMILWVLKAFKQDEDFLLNYQELYQYVLVDEYQDTSGAQNELINLLMNYWDKPNLFIVGDEDQSIFRFQGANTENFNQFRKQYSKDLLEITLDENYRSSQPILDACKSLIDHKNSGYKKTLTAQKGTLNPSPNSPLVIEFDDKKEIQEYAFVLYEVQQLLQKGIKANEIAILYRNHKIGEELASYFLKAEIGIHLKRKTNALQDPFGKQIIILLKYIAQESKTPFSEDNLLFELLHYPYWGIDGVELAQLSFCWANENNELRKSRKTPLSFRYYIAKVLEKTVPSFFEPQHWVNLRNTHQLLELLIKTQHSLTIQDLFEELVRKSNMIGYMSQHRHKYWLMQVLSGIFDLVKQETQKHPDWKLIHLVDFFNKMESNKLRLELAQNLHNDHGINFMTCHSSKGLEFEYVFLIGANSKNWEKKRNNNSDSYKFPDTIFGQSVPMTNNEETKEELRRLFYVACTRAKNYLCISYSGEQSLFVAEMNDFVQRKQNTDYQQYAPDTFLTLFKEDTIPVPPLIDNNIIKPWVENYTLSASHLNSYLRCPISYYFENIVRVPQKKSGNLTFGSAVHFALERVFKAMLEDPDKNFPSKDKLIRDFEWFLYKERDAFSDEDYKIALERGKLYLPRYYQHNIATWNKVVVCEQNIKNVHFQGTPIKGMLDKIEFEGKNAKVVDYKTGSFNNAKDKLSRPTEKNPLGGDYWRQAVFYKILVDSYPQKNWSVTSAVFDFIEPQDGELKSEKIIITPEDLAIVGSQIENTYKKIKNLEFSQGCNKTDCQWCNFIKNQETDFKFGSNDE